MFFTSSVLKGMLDASGVSPLRLEQAIAGRLRRRMSYMREVDHFPRMLRKATGAVVTRLRLRNRYVLLELNGRGLYYWEDNATDRSVMAPGTLPETLMTAARGRRLQEVVDLGSLAPVLGACTITAAGPGWEGATKFHLEPEWLRFGC